MVMKRTTNASCRMVDRYLEQVLILIDRAGGSQGINLREVSRSLGYSHTNAYNYFKDLEDLRWKALEVAIERQLRHTKQVMTPMPSDRDMALNMLIGNQFDFAFEHPGWYRFIWLEALPGLPPDPVILAITHAGLEFIGMVASCATRKLSEERAMEMGGLFHTFLHGALCKVIAGRVHSDRVDEIRNKFIDDARKIFVLLDHEFSRSTRKRRT